MNPERLMLLFLMIFAVFYGGEARQKILIRPTETRYQRHDIPAAATGSNVTSKIYKDMRTIKKVKKHNTSGISKIIIESNSMKNYDNGETAEFEPTKKDLRNIREWIAKSPHIVQDYDDQFLSAFFRGCKGSLQKVKKNLEGFNGLSKRYPNMIKNYDPLDTPLVENLSETLTFVLPKKAHDGSTVFFAAYRHYDGFKSDPYKAHSTEYYRYWLLSVYTSIWKNQFDSGKWILVTDFEGSTLPHLREYTPELIKQAVDMMQNALPVRMQAVHVINVPSFMEYLLNKAKGMMKKEIAKRMHFHSSVKKFNEQFQREILPKEYGGSEESALKMHDRWYKTVKSFRGKFLEEGSKMKKLDPLRPKFLT